MCHYLPYEKGVVLTDLSFPMSPKKDCDLWNKWHWDYSQLLAFDEDSKSFVVLYLSPESHCRQHVVNLLLLDGVVQSTCDSVHHYVYTKAFVTSGFSQSKHHTTQHICVSCMERFDFFHSIRSCVSSTILSKWRCPEKSILFSRSKRQFPFLFILWPTLNTTSRNLQPTAYVT